MLVKLTEMEAIKTHNKYIQFAQAFDVHSFNYLQLLLPKILLHINV